MATNPKRWSAEATASYQIDTERAVSKLDNGLTVVLEPLPHVRSLTAGVWVRTGSANESERLAGVSHFLEHLVFKGTESRSARDLMDAIESRGAHMNAFTSREFTCYYVKCLDEHLDVALDILADMVQRPVLNDFEKERAVILEEIASCMDVPEEYVHDLLTQQMWPDHPLGRPVPGSIESVSGIGVDDVHAYRRQWYEPRHIIVSIAGHIDEAHARDRVAHYFGEMTPRSNGEMNTAPAFHAGVEACPMGIAQNHVALAFGSPSLLDERRHVADLLGNLLGGGSTSRLFERIREDEGLAYAVYSFHAPFATAGMLGVYAAVAPENLQKTLSITSDELRRLHREPVGDVELESNKEQLKGGLLLALEGTFNRMARLARSLIYFGEIKTIDEIIAEVDAVTSDDIQRLAVEVFHDNNAAVTILGPEPKRSVALELG